MRTTTPFTPVQCTIINQYQLSGIYSPLTCPKLHNQYVILHAQEDGLVCGECGFKQDWVYSFMTEYEGLTKEFVDPWRRKEYNPGSYKSLYKTDYFNHLDIKENNFYIPIEIKIKRHKFSAQYLMNIMGGRPTNRQLAIRFYSQYNTQPMSVASEMGNFLVQRGEMLYLLRVTIFHAIEILETMDYQDDSIKYIFPNAIYLFRHLNIIIIKKENKDRPDLWTIRILGNLVAAYFYRKPNGMYRIFIYRLWGNTTNCECNSIAAIIKHMLNYTLQAVDHDINLINKMKGSI
jgi:hypothetical protein